jgi:RNA polymerase sigma-70 factor (ECF subfamily)
MWPLWAVADRLDPTGEGPRRPVEEPAADREAVRQMVARDQRGLASLYDRYGRMLFSFAVRVVGGSADAEDVVQEVFAQAWRQASRYDSARGSVAGWLLMMARARAIDAVRARRARPDTTTDEHAFDALRDAAALPDATVLTQEQAAALRSALSELPFVQRMAIELAFYEGLTQSEIAERLEQPLGTIKTRIRLGLLKLRDALGETHA